MIVGHSPAAESDQPKEITGSVIELTPEMVKIEIFYNNWVNRIHIVLDDIKILYD